MRENLSLEEYLRMFEDKELYRKRLDEETEVGKGCFVAAMCPVCYRQLKTEMRQSFKGTKYRWCKCGNNKIQSAEIVNAVTPEHWNATLGPTYFAPTRW